MEIFFLFPFIFFIFTVIVMLWIIKKRFAANLGAEKIPERKSALGEVLSRLKEQAEMSEKGAEREKTGRERKKTPSSKMEVVWEKGMGFDSPPPLPAKKPERRKTPPSKTPPAVSAPPAGEKEPTWPERASPKKITVARLREAVVWSEILAPPVALRKDDDF